MSINWQWTDKMGTVTDERGYTSNLYRGNCFMIAVNEFKDERGVDVYSLAWFFADETHLKKCFGLTKGYEENHPNDYHWQKFELNTEYKETAKFIQYLAKAKANVEIKLFNKEKEYK